MQEATKSIAILGCGNIGGAIARGLVASTAFQPADLTLTRRGIDGLEKFAALGFKTSSDNLAALRAARLVILAVTPQQINGLLEEIKPVLQARKHILVSVVSGASIRQIKTRVPAGLAVVRVMPNTAIAFRQSMTCLCAEDQDERAMREVTEIFDRLGRSVVIREDLMVPATALCACGTAFFLRAIRAASQGGVEIGFHAEEALTMAAQTAKGAASLLLERSNHPEREVDKVTTPQGCTIAGLNQMEHSGFSSSMIRGIVTAAEKARNLYRKNEHDRD